MYKLIFGAAGWVLALALGVSLYKTDTAAVKRHAEVSTKLSACNTTLEGLIVRQRAAKIESDAANEAARVLADKHEKRADVIMGKPSTRPDDMCASAEDRIKEWQNSRR